MAAFQSAIGHGNLPNGNFSPTIFSQKVLKFFRRASVAEDITNTDYFGEIVDFGNTVNIIKEPQLTVSAYSRGQHVVPQDLIDDQIVLTVDQANAFAFKVDDIEEKHAHVNWQSLATSSAAYKLKDTFDVNVLTNISDNVLAANIYGSDGSPRDLGFSAGEESPLSIMNRLGRLLDDQDVPEDGRWFVAKPLFWEQMMDENSKLMGVDFTGDGDSILRNGRVTNGLIRNFRVYKSNNMPSGTNEIILAGHISAVATASQIAKTEMLRDQDTFSDIVRGLHLFGRKVLRTTALAKAWFKVD